MKSRLIVDLVALGLLITGAGAGYGLHKWDGTRPRDDEFAKRIETNDWNPKHDKNALVQQPEMPTKTYRIDLSDSTGIFRQFATKADLDNLATRMERLLNERLPPLPPQRNQNSKPVRSP